MKFLRYNTSMFVMIVALLFPVAGFAESTASIADMQRLLVSLKAQLASMQQSAAAQSNTTTPFITRSLALGSTGADVAALQQILKDKGYFKAEPTGYFGPITRQAVAALQSAYALEPVGHVGPQTRKLLNGLRGSTVSPSISASDGALFLRTLDLGSRGDDVMALQQHLKSKGYLNAEPTGYYGTLTNEAVKRFQQANSFEPIGVVGPKTRALLNALVDTNVPRNDGAVPASASKSSPAPAISQVAGGGGGSGGSSTPVPSSPVASSGDGGGGSTASVPTSQTTGGGGGAPASTSGISDAVPPSIPTGLNGTAVSSSQINLAWTASTDNVGVSGYKIFRNGAQVGTSAGARYSDTGLAASTVYAYTIAAYDVAGNSSAQSSSSATITLGTAPLAIAIGSRITTTANLNIRSGAGFTMTALGSQPMSAEGTVVAGPASADGRIWWKINYDTGVDGWSIADYLIAIAPASSPAVGIAEPIRRFL